MTLLGAVVIAAALAGANARPADASTTLCAAPTTTVPDTFPAEWLDCPVGDRQAALSGEAQFDVGSTSYDYGGVGFGYDTSGDGSITYGAGNPATATVYGPSPARVEADLLRAQEEAGTAPPVVPGENAPTDFAEDGDDSASLDVADQAVVQDLEDLGALDLGAPELDVATLGIAVGLQAFSGTPEGHYVLSLLWGTFASGAPDAQLGQAGQGQLDPPTWIYSSNICSNGSQGGLGPGWYLDWGGTDQDWQSNMGGDTGECGLYLPSTLENNLGNGVTQQEYADDKAMWDTEEDDVNSSACPEDGPQFTPTGTFQGPQHGPWNTTYTIERDVLWMTTEQYADQVMCVMYAETPGELDLPTEGATIRAPFPGATVALNTGAGPYVGADSDVSTQVTNDLQAAPAYTVDPETGSWTYDGDATVTYGPYVVPEDAAYVRIGCTDDTSDTDWTPVTGGQTVTLTRTGIGFDSGDGPDFDCYVDAAPDQEYGQFPDTEDPDVSPNPENFTEGDPIPAPGGSDSCNCTFDFSPLTTLDLGNKLPFGIVGYVSGVLSQLDPTGHPLSYTIGGHTITLGTQAWDDTYRPIAFDVIEFILTVTAIVYVAIRHLRNNGAEA